MAGIIQMFHVGVFEMVSIFFPCPYIGGKVVVGGGGCFSFFPGNKDFILTKGCSLVEQCTRV